MHVAPKETCDAFRRAFLSSAASTPHLDVSISAKFPHSNLHCPACKTTRGRADEQSLGNGSNQLLHALRGSSTFCTPVQIAEGCVLDNNHMCHAVLWQAHCRTNNTRAS
eukprot:4073034-Pyramimonas_sp.AAC.1